MTGTDPMKVPSQDQSPDGLDGKHVSDLISPETKIGPSGEVTGTLKWVSGVANYRDGITEGHFFPVVFDEKYAGKVKTSKRNGTYRGESEDQEWTIYVPDKNTTFTFETDEDGVFQTLSFKNAEFANPIGKDAFDAAKTDYGGFGKTENYYDNVIQTWDGSNCTVTGKLKWVKKDTAIKLGSDGNYFAFKLTDYYKGKNITVAIGDTEKSANETDWVCKITAGRKSITVKDGATVIATFDLSQVELADES